MPVERVCRSFCEVGNGVALVTVPLAVVINSRQHYFVATGFLQVPG